MCKLQEYLIRIPLILLRSSEEQLLAKKCVVTVLNRRELLEDDSFNWVKQFYLKTVNENENEVTKRDNEVTNLHMLPP